ncbi:hypothetical protein LPJ63_000386 [Coemansia sp. RSA 2711]|nr:hypothetical protein LPJ63_000386 [Coemansia sp. RSA 2711]KAJ2365400.1 hypothetical protein H4S01_003267 [Coemansia sp. RSA 2610]KAJ2387427.1 hypothetical protein H4S02_003373 [Coemansia sp. RSA 2611]
MPAHNESGGMAVTAPAGSASASPASSASPPASGPEQPIKVVLETEPPARKPGRPRLDISAHFQDTGEMANHSHRFVWCIGCIKSGRLLYKKDRLPARGDLMQRHIQTCKHVSDEVRQKFSSQRSSSASSAGDNKARKARIANIISESGSAHTHKASSASPRARSRSRLRAAAAASPVPASAAPLPPISTLGGPEHISPPAIAGPVHSLPVAVPSPRPLPPTLRPPFSHSRPGSGAEGVQLPRIRSPQIRSATPMDLPPISRRPHPYLGRDLHYYGHGAGAGAGLRVPPTAGTPILPPPRIHTPPQQRAFLAPPQHSMRSSPSSVGSSTIASEPPSALFAAQMTPPAPVMPSPQPLSHDIVSGTGSTLRQKLQNGREAAYGIVLSIPSPITARIAARLGFDWACIDMEHSPQSASIMAEMVEAVSSSGTCAPLVRVPSHSSEWIKWAVEAGAHGIIIPSVQSRGQMVQLVSACRGASAPHAAGSSFSAPAAVQGHHRMLPPMQQPQQRSPKLSGPSTYGRPHASASPDNTRMPALRVASPAALGGGSDVLVIPQIENVDVAGSSVEDILSVPGVDAAFVHLGGPWGSNGRVSPAAARDRASSDVLGHMLQISRRLAVPLGTDSADGSAARMAARQGLRMVAVGSDVDVLASAAADQLRLAQTR